MSTKVYKYYAHVKRGGLPVLREQMAMGRRYYNLLVAAENARRQRGWGGPHAPAPPHENCKIKKCPECKAHWKSVCDAVRAQPLLDIKPLRAMARAAGLYWGTYLKVEEAFAAAWKTTKVWHSVSFRSWQAGGQVSIQVQGDKPGDDRLYRLIDVRDPDKGKSPRFTLELRIGSNGRAPVWSAPIPILVHRPLVGRVRWVIVTMTHEPQHNRERWAAHFVVDRVPEREDGAERGIVAIDIGWRRLQDGSTRLAFARGDDGRLYELTLPKEWRELDARADRIQEVRDKTLNEIKDRYSVLARVKSCQGAARVVSKLPAGSLSPDLFAWLHRDRHLWQYERGCRRRSVARRRNDVRVWLRDLRRQYAEVIIKDSSHKEMKEAKQLPRPARRSGQRAAPGEIVEEIGKVWGRQTGVHVVSAVDTTGHCPMCHHVTKHGPERLIVCEQCGDAEDRDKRSTRNMMALYVAGDTGKPTARKTRARFAKRHKKSESPDNANTTA